MSKSPNRRRFLGNSAFAAACLATPGLFADELLRTAAVGEGPFYPDRLPLDTDNDLLVINESTTPALGTVTHLTGRVLSETGTPIRNAFVEIWQCDQNGSYIHSGSSNKEDADANFQGYGRFLTDVRGQYYFRTIKPVPYPGRTPHIHFGVSLHGRRVFTTQMLINGEEANERDGLFRQISDPELRKTILVDFNPIEDSKIGEVSAEFEIVLGRTAEEDDDGSIKGIGPSVLEQQRRGSR